MNLKMVVVCILRLSEYADIDPIYLDSTTSQARYEILFMPDPLMFSPKRVTAKGTLANSSIQCR